MYILNRAVYYLLAKTSWDDSPATNSAARHPLTLEEAKEFVPYVFGAPTIHHLEKREMWLTPVGYELIPPASLNDCDLPPQVEKRELCFFDVETGLKFALFRKEEHLLILFAALNGSETEVEERQRSAYKQKNIRTAIYNFWGKPLLFQKAYACVKAIKDNPEFQHLKVTLSGQSFGGGVSAYVALKLKIDAVCFNSLPLGYWVKREVDTDDFTSLAKRHITHILIESDWLSDNFFLQSIDKRLPFDLPMPQLFGEKRYVPTAYPNNVSRTHASVIGSLKAFLGIDNATPPGEMMRLLSET